MRISSFLARYLIATVTVVLLSQQEANAQNSVQIRTAESSRFGSYLTDGAGRPVYIFTAEKTRGETQIACESDRCLAAWPLLTTTEHPPEAEGEVETERLGTLDHNGRTVVTYDGWPLHRHTADNTLDRPQGNGVQSFDGTWSLIRPSGEAVAARAQPATRPIEIRFGATGPSEVFACSIPVQVTASSGHRLAWFSLVGELMDGSTSLGSTGVTSTSFLIEDKTVTATPSTEGVSLRDPASRYIQAPQEIGISQENCGRATHFRIVDAHCQLERQREPFDCKSDMRVLGADPENPFVIELEQTEELL